MWHCKAFQLSICFIRIWSNDLNRSTVERRQSFTRRAPSDVFSNLTSAFTVTCTRLIFVGITNKLGNTFNVFSVRVVFRQTAAGPHIRFSFVCRPYTLIDRVTDCFYWVKLLGIIFFWQFWNNRYPKVTKTKFMQCLGQHFINRYIFPIP